MYELLIAKLSFGQPLDQADRDEIVKALEELSRAKMIVLEKFFPKVKP